MSRLIVKGLPARYEDKNLRELFTPLGEVTDARIIKTAEGKSRCFGFIGFKTKQDAARAKHAMNKAYVDTRLVIVETAHAKGDESIARPWSRYSAGSSKYNKINGIVNYGHGLRDDYDQDNKDRNGRTNSEREEKNKNVDNDDQGFAAFEEALSKSKNPAQPRTTKIKDKSQLVESKRIGSKGKVVERKHVTFEDDESEDDEDALYEELPGKDEDSDKNKETDESSGLEAEVGDEVALNETVSDMDYFKSKITKQTTDTEENSDNEEKSDDENNNSNSDDDSDQSDDDGDNDFDDKKKNEVSGKKVKPSTEEEDVDKATDSDSESDVDDLFNNKRKNESSADGKTLNESDEQKEKVSKKSYENQHDDVDAGETGRLLVRNLAFSVTEEDLETEFEQFGTLSEVHIVRDVVSNKSRGMGFLQYCVPEQAAKALVAMDGSFHCGRILHVLAARPKPSKHNESNGIAIFQNQNGSISQPGGSTFKSEREQATKESAKTGQDAIAQHGLHLSADAVAEVAAERHGVSKSELFGSGRGESGVAAVRLAVAEATVQGETKTYLKENGIDMSVLLNDAMGKQLGGTTNTAKKKRLSRLAFLVKNLPAKTNKQELMNIFTKFGKLSKLLIVPSGLLGVVQFTIASDARRAYNGLAYTKFKDTPLYLEWLPSEAILKDNGKENVELEMVNENKNNDEKSIPKKDTSPKNEKSTTLASPTTSKEEADKADDDNDGQGCSIYVKNLSFETRDKQLQSHFENILKKKPEVLKNLRSAKVALKKGPEGKESEKLSMGFGFLEFNRPTDAREAMKLGQNSNLDGHTLRLQLSRKRDDGGDKVKKRKRKGEQGVKSKPCSKLIIRNVSFEATRRDVRQLFETFGQLKVVRMPQKMDGSHRGFAFVEYISKNEAASAYEALKDTHLYGRHLVIEYAKEDSEGGANIEELQERAARDVVDKKRRRVFGDGDAQRNSVEEKDDTAMMRDELYG